MPNDATWLCSRTALVASSVWKQLIVKTPKPGWLMVALPAQLRLLSKRAVPKSA